jgi:hypothetical protein
VTLSESEYEGKRVRIRPDLLKLESFIRENLTDTQKRDGPEATIVNVEFASHQLVFNLEIDNVPNLHRFKDTDCEFVEGTKP